MHPRSHTTALLLTLALTTKTYATTYTWSGTSANFSDPTAWIGPIPSPNGSPTDQLLFPDTPPNSTYTITLDSPNPITLNTLTLGSANSLINAPRLIATINALSTGSLLFDGLNPTITLIPTTYLDTNDPSHYYPYSDIPFVTSNAPIASTSDLTISGSGTFTLAAPLSFTNNNAQLNVAANLTYQNNTAPAGLTQTNITNNGQVTWNYTPADASPTSLTFGSGNVTLNNASFQIALPQNSPSGFSLNLTNDLNVQGLSVCGTYIKNYDYNLPEPTGRFNYSGTIHLNGLLEVNVQFATDITGNVEVDESGDIQPSIFGYNSSGTTPSEINLSGNIVNDPNPLHNGTKPLQLEGFIISGAHNTYSVGTKINVGEVFVTSNSSLGTGSVDISQGTLHLSSPTNIALGRKALVEQYGTLAITFDADPSSLIDPASNGTLALDVNFSTPLNMATLGNGMMNLVSTNKSTYSATSLAPGIDHIYRFGSYNDDNNSLTLLHPVLADYNNILSSAQLAAITLASSNSYSGGTTITGIVYATAPGAFGTGNLTIGTSYNPYIDISLSLTAPNTYAPTATVNLFATLAVVGPNGSIPFTNNAPILHPGSTLILGDGLNNNSDRYPDTLPLNLDNSSLILQGIGTTNETVGPLSYNGASMIVLLNPTDGTHSTILHAPSLSSAPHSVLFIIPFAYAANTFLSSPISSFTPTDPNNGNLQLDTPPTVTNSIVSPSIQTRSTWNSPQFVFAGFPTSFLTYGSNGFALPTYSPMPTNGGTGTEVVDLLFSFQNPSILPIDTSIYALRISNELDNPSTGPVTLHIQSGGVISYSSLIQPNIDFGNAEAYLNSSANTEISGIVTAHNGITKFGFGTFTLSNPANQIHGPITILEGGLQFSSLPDPDSTDPIQLDAGTSLTFLHPTILTRPISFSPSNYLVGNHGAGDISSTINTADGQSLTIATPIVTDLPVTLGNQNAPIHISAPITSSASLLIAGSEINITASVNADLTLRTAGKLTGDATITFKYPFYLYKGTIAPGNAPGDIGTLTFNATDTELSNNAALELDLDSSGPSDRLFFTGSLTIDASTSYSQNLTSLTLNFLSPPTNQTYTLISYASITGTFATVNGLPANYSLDYTPTALLLIPNNASPIPEPTTLSLLTLTTPLLLSRRRPK